MTDCQWTLDRLDDYLDGELARDETSAIRRHLADCTRCCSSERALRGLLERAASLPRAIDPPRELWPEIERRLAVAGRRAGGPGATWGRPTKGAWISGLLAASLLAVGLAAGYLLRGTELRPTQVPARASSSSPAIRTAVGAGDLVLAEQAIVEAERELRTLLDERPGALSAETVRTVERNLAVIEAAIDEIQTVLARDPDNRDLGRRLLTARQRQLNLLQRATQLGARPVATDSI
ncbi:MAG TPA: zf-HC2 domain-containing protein [Candidatus Polarisedimenticolaceae bacterium]|nr:zf-HC2 domain-containing protein [Candidatus Polarisedimenticolaceae bacterium]